MLVRRTTHYKVSVSICSMVSETIVGGASCAVIVVFRAYIRSTTTNDKERRGERDAIGRVSPLAAQ